MLVTTTRYRKHMITEPELVIYVDGPLTQKNLDGVLRNNSGTHLILAAQKHGIVGFGSGRALEYAKAIANFFECDLELIPGVLTTDTPWTNSYAIRDFKKDTIVYKKIDIKFKTTVNKELLRFIYMREYPHNVDKWCIPELVCHFTAWWDMRYGEGMDEKIYKQCTILANSLVNLPEIGTESWYRTISHLFTTSVTLQIMYGDQIQEGSEHYVSYYAELVGGMTGLHGQLLSVGLDAVFPLQVNSFISVWNLLQSKYGLKTSPPWEELPRGEIVKFIKRNKLRECVITDEKRIERYSGNDSKPD